MPQLGPMGRGSSNLLAEADTLSSTLVAVRRDLHRHPELGFQEIRTAGMVAARLRDLGLEVRERVGQTGVVGLLRGGGQTGRVVAIRADMDALPLQEEGTQPYRSEVPGRMHACGHDAHVACALGAAMLLALRRADLPGCVKFLFQPAEEPGEGAKAMIADGALRDPPVDAVIALHTYPALEAGQVGIRAGPLMAQADTVRILIQGAGGHGAEPHRTIDPIIVTAAVVLQLQTVVSRSLDPLEPGVISIGTLRAGSSEYVIPSSAELTGTVRARTPEVSAELMRRIRRVAEKTADAYGATATVEFRPLCPPVVNDERVTAILQRAACRVLGVDAMARATPTMAAEDFAFFLEQVPGTLFWLGVGEPGKGSGTPWHHPCFDIDEGALTVGSVTLAQACWEYLAAPDEGAHRRA